MDSQFVETQWLQNSYFTLLAQKLQTWKNAFLNQAAKDWKWHKGITASQLFPFRMCYVILSHKIDIDV